MVILILLNLVILLYIFFKYYRIPNNIKMSTQEIKNENSMVIVYIDNKDFNNFDLMLAEIIELNIKHYIIIEYNNEGINKYDYTIKQNINMNSDKLNRYELLVLSFLFPNEQEITKTQLEEKLRNTFGSYNIQYNELEKI